MAKNKKFLKDSIFLFLNILQNLKYFAVYLYLTNSTCKIIYFKF